MGKTKKIRIAFQVIAGLYAAAVAVLCFAKFDPAFIEEQSALLHLTDKDIHFLMFLPFIPLGYLAFGRWEWKMKGTCLFTGAMLLASAAITFLIELLQGQTGYRGEDVYDALAGIGGALTGGVILLIIKALKLRKTKSVKAAALFLVAGLSLACCNSLSAQLRDDFTPCCDSLSVRLERRTGVKETLKLKKVLRRGKQLDFYFNETLGDYPWRAGDESWFKKELKSLFPKKYASNTVGAVFSKSRPLSEFVTPSIGNDGTAIKSPYRISAPKTSEAPLVSEIGAQNFSKGLTGRNIALWQSHGYYYEQSLQRWEWQRACLFQTVEDLFTQSFVLPFLIPMLENAGAYVMTPRERDLNFDEYIIDNDLGETSRTGGKFTAEGDWEMRDGGFADASETISDNSNPFIAGTYLCARAALTAKKKQQKITWEPEIRKEGEYAVYISYRSLPESTEGALYRVEYRGGVKEFYVNQRLGGGTWVYLGTFPFAPGEKAKVTLDCSRSKGKNSSVTADALRIGGGMGNIARGTPDADSLAREISGMPRFAEGARYSLQWYGVPKEVWSQNEEKSDYKDDYMCRGTWVDWISGGSAMNPKAPGLGIPVDLSLAFHTDAGIAARDSTIGTLAIYTSLSEGLRNLPSGEKRLTSREYADAVQTQVVEDIRATFDPAWRRRGTKDRSYLESRTPTAPAMILELLSHQNFNDMKFGLDPEFRFTVSRAVYKGMLKYLSSRYGVPYAVEPLPVKDFAAGISSVSDREFTVDLSWKPSADPLEPTATPTGYILSTAEDDGAFSEGKLLKEISTGSDGRLHCSLTLSKGHIHSFRITAFNEGGRSFPSQTLSAGVPQGLKSKGNVLIVNNFDRVAMPSFIETEAYAGFDNRSDGGVDFGKRINFIGEMYQFNRSLPWVDDDCPGFGASYTDCAASVYAGNTFDYPSLHGRALLSLGYSFASMSREAFCEGVQSFGNGTEQIVDLLCGKQITTPRGTGKMAPRFSLFPPLLQERLKACTERGCNLIVSGANIGTDLSDAIYPVLRDKETSESARNFAASTLGYSHINSHGSRSGEYRWTLPGKKGERGSIYSAPNSERYWVESPDGIVPSSAASETFLRYSDTGISAATAYTAEGYKAVCIGFPLETVKDFGKMEEIFEYCLKFFK